MNLRSFYIKYQDFLKESVDLGIGKSNSQSIENQSDDLFVAERIERDDSYIIQKTCFLLFIIFGDADEYTWEDEDDSEPWDGIKNTWTLDYSIFDTQPKYNPEFKNLHQELNIPNIPVPGYNGYSFDVSEIYYDVKYPTRYYLGGPCKTKKATFCSWNAIRKDKPDAHCRVYFNKSEYSKDTFAPGQLDMTYPENIPLEYQKWFFTCILKFVIDKLNEPLRITTWYKFHDYNGDRRSRMINTAIRNYPDKKICTWAKYNLL